MLRIVILTLCLSAAAQHHVNTTLRRVARNAGDPDTEIKDAHLRGMCKAVSVNDRVECPFPGAAEVDDTLCTAAGCCINRGFEYPPNLCFFAREYPRYWAISITDDEETVNMSLLVHNPMQKVLTAHNVSVSVSYYSKEVARVLVDRARLPNDDYSFVPAMPALSGKGAFVDVMYDVVALLNGMLTIHRKDEGGDFEKGVPVFSTNFSYLTFDLHYKQVTLFLPSSRIYGLGTRVTPLQLPIPSDFFLFNREIGPDKDGMGRGTHPMYICLEDGGTAHGVYLHNTNGMEVKLRPGPSITFKVYGGRLDFYIFMGPTPADVVRQYLELVGKPAIPPYWGLGYHLSRHGFKTLEDVKKVVSRNQYHFVPFESIWIDIKYADDYFVFSLSKDFKGMGEFVDGLHSKSQRCVLNFPPFVRKSGGYYYPFDEGRHLKMFVKNSTYKPSFCTAQIDVDAVYVNFLAYDVIRYWGFLLQNFHDVTRFDGAWLTHTNPRCIHLYAAQCDSTSPLENPSANPPERLNKHTMCMEDIMYDSMHYDVHNVYGYYAAMITHQSLASRMRPFVMTGTTFAGQGKWSGQWLGESESTWESMRESIPMALTSNLLGMPFVGADICGTKGNVTETLCVQWHALGIFYPFARNHNEEGFVDQDPVGLMIHILVYPILKLRLLLLPFLYTLFYRNAVHGEPVMRPLFLEYPKDENTYAIDTQFMWGSALLINPLLHPDTNHITPYIPRGIWYDYFEGTPIIVNEGRNKTFRVSEMQVNVLIRAGHVIPLQKPGVTASESRNNQFILLVAPTDTGEAGGELFWDDGTSPDTVTKGSYTLYRFELLQNLLVATLVKHGYKTGLKLGSIKVLRVLEEPLVVRMNDVNTTYTYDTENKVLKIDVNDFVMDENFMASW
ncbi:probable maltase-glucoamylase 2 [Ornithodoros turicata]|uniref:probable maltase-glucoamylase 2 n=1 Tax=Ornithodoros turicata TaxID=34597 RepID=UPI0031396A83